MQEPLHCPFYQGGLVLNATISVFFYLEKPINRLLRFFAALFSAAIRLVSIPTAQSTADRAIKYSTSDKVAKHSAADKTAKHSAADKATVNQQAERLLDTYGTHILRLAYSYLHNLSDAEEVLQDTLMQFLKKTPTFESKEHEKAWLLRVAINLSKNRLTYNKIRTTDELNEALLAEEKENLSYVWEAVKQLPERYREVIHLYYYEGYPTAQIARLLKRNESTIRSDLCRGRERLKTILKEVYDFE